MQLVDENPKWWKVKSGRKEGFASKHYFVHKDARKEYERKPWYFGDMTREDAERLLGHTANNDGFVLSINLSFAIRADMLDTSIICPPLQVFRVTNTALIVKFCCR